MGMSKKAGKYRPANGTEGERFMYSYCYRCKSDEEFRRGVGGSCEILTNTMVYAVDDPLYPDEWTYDENGMGTCVAFEPGTESVPGTEDAPFLVWAMNTDRWVMTEQKAVKLVAEMAAAYIRRHFDFVCDHDEYCHCDHEAQCREAYRIFTARFGGGGG